MTSVYHNSAGLFIRVSSPGRHLKYCLEFTRRDMKPDPNYFRLKSLSCFDGFGTTMNIHKSVIFVYLNI